MTTNKKTIGKKPTNLAIQNQPVNQVVLSFDDQQSAYDDDLQKAFDLVSTCSGDVASIIESEVGDIEAYKDSDAFKSTMSSLNAKKATGTFSVIGMVLQANEYQRNDFQKKKVRSFMVTMRITKNAISDQELARIGGRFVEDVYGDYFAIPVHCNLGRDKYAAYMAKKQLEEANDAQIETQANILAAVSKVDGKKRPATNTVDVFAKKQKLNDGSSKSSATTSAPQVDEPNDDEPSMAIVSVSDSQVDLSDSQNLSKSTTNFGADVYNSWEIDGKPYKGRDIVVLMKLPINKDISFSIEEKSVTVDPCPWTIISADIKANPYVNNEEKYSVSGWTICSMAVKQQISKVDMYKYFEMSCQSSPVYTSLYQYLEETAGKPKKTFVAGEKQKSTPLENSTLCWFVVGNELTFSNPYRYEHDGYHVVYTLQRSRSPGLFQKEDPATVASKLPEKKMVGQIPYIFEILQWKGKLDQNNPTVTKCRLSIYVNWKHICPSNLTSQNYKPQPDNTLGINSITAWVCLMCANYVHIKMAINAKESFSSNAEIKLNLDRYAEAKHRSDPTYMMLPHAEAKDRFMLPIFHKTLFMQRAVLLPLETIKSCCIPVTQDYIVNVAWKDRIPPQSVPGSSDIDKGVPFRAVDLNNNIHCLSESQNTEKFFTDDISAVNSRYNFYAMANVCFKQKSESYDDSSIKFLKHLPKSTGEGIIWLEALRHIVCSGALKGCYKTEKSSSFPDFGDIPNNEKYVQYLKSFPDLPATSNLFTVRLDDLQVFHESSRLVVYFYAVSKMVDDSPQERGKCLNQLRTSLSENILQVLTNKEDTNDNEGDSEEDGKSPTDENDNGDDIKKGGDGDENTSASVQQPTNNESKDITAHQEDKEESQEETRDDEAVLRKPTHRKRKGKKQRKTSDDDEDDG